MLIYSMSVSVDGFIADPEGAFGWTPPGEELFRFHTTLVSELGGYLLGRRLYETMLVWQTDPSMRDNELGPRSRMSGARSRRSSSARRSTASRATHGSPGVTGRRDRRARSDRQGRGAGLAAQAIDLGLVDELRMSRYPVVVGGGTPFLPPVTDAIALDLIETRTFGSRVIYERYGRARAL